MHCPRIRFIIPYFGVWPFWIHFFIQSCRYNPSIDWLLITDCGIPDDLPDNVIVREASFESYCDEVSQRLGIHFRPAGSYKLCDIKPALGYIHQEDLLSYDFWAFGDIDVIYGDLRSYFNAERLAAYDLLSTHASRISGHLCLVRNIPAMNMAFMHVRNWGARLEDARHVAFDESAFCHLFIKHKNWPTILRRLADRLNSWRRRSEFQEAYSTPDGRIAWIDGERAYPRVWFWKSGLLTNDRDGERSFPYFHFMVWKKAWRSNQEFKRVSPGASWKIDHEGFHVI